MLLHLQSVCFIKESGMKALSVSIGSATSKGKKAINQDFLGHQIPAEPLLTTRGVTLAIADGISSSPVSQAASETAVTSFLRRLLPYVRSPGQ